MKRNLFNFKKFLTTKHKLNEIKNQLHQKTKQF